MQSFSFSESNNKQQAMPKDISIEFKICRRNITPVRPNILVKFILITNKKLQGAQVLVDARDKKNSTFSFCRISAREAFLNSTKQNSTERFVEFLNISNANPGLTHAHISRPLSSRKTEMGATQLPFRSRVYAQGKSNWPSRSSHFNEGKRNTQRILVVACTPQDEKQTEGIVTTYLKYMNFKILRNVSIFLFC